MRRGLRRFRGQSGTILGPKAPNLGPKYTMKRWQVLFIRLVLYVMWVVYHIGIIWVVYHIGIIWVVCHIGIIWVVYHIGIIWVVYHIGIIWVVYHIGIIYQIGPIVRREALAGVIYQFGIGTKYAVRYLVSLVALRGVLESLVSLVGIPAVVYHIATIYHIASTVAG